MTHRHWLARLGACSLALLSACGGSGSPKASDASARKAEPAPAPEPNSEDAPAKAETKSETKAEDEDRSIVAVVEPDHEPDDWLVWFDDGGRWTTRWIDAADADTPRVAERRALVVSDGSRLWTVERHDGEVDVASCECIEEGEDSPGCATTERVATLGLQAVELPGGSAVAIRKPSDEPLIGGDVQSSIDVSGGAGSRLFYRWSESGYFCGAHGMVEGGDVVFDLGAGKDVEKVFAPIQASLPKGVLDAAGRELHEQLRECEGFDAPSLSEVIGDRMGLTGLHLSLRKGEPRITWAFEADVYYACSPDYAVHGQGISGLEPAAASLGLAGPLPAGLSSELKRIGESHTLGWSRLELSGPGRAEAIAAFSAAPETPWPKSFASSRPIASPAPAATPATPGTVVTPAATAEAKAKLSEGRTQTRAGEHAKAIATFDAAIALDPGLARAWSERGYAKLLAGDLAGARADLEHALPLDDGAGYQASIHYNLGLVAERQHDAAAAKAAFERSLELRDNETVRKALARVE